MKYTEEIFNILSSGKFITDNSVTPEIRIYYDLVEEDFEAYRNYYEGIGFILEGGDGYYCFSRRDRKVEVERKLERMLRWIDYLDFFKTCDASFSSGTIFTPSDILVKISADIELQSKARRLFDEKKTNREVVDRLISELETFGFAELESEIDSTYKVTSAYNFLERVISFINVSKEVKDEIPE